MSLRLSRRIVYQVILIISNSINPPYKLAYEAAVAISWIEPYTAKRNKNKCSEIEIEMNWGLRNAAVDVGTLSYEEKLQIAMRQEFLGSELVK
ncbi:hypothetical protein Glove_168g242 [Diversispora epigaea]|uniref:Uncharacterized protein n=1 Tax=Diversispora epigaea TaxID=1348612 RepID=A0A397IPU1_9GLOM|nr:hypothetical protein Glove_168g242 [Diversispora epigaea]